MYRIPSQEIAEEFVECWKAAGMQLQDMVRSTGVDFAWLKADLRPPMLEHFSFRLGNQLSFVRVVDADARIEGPSSLDGLMSIAAGCKGYPCLMPMRLRGSEWRPVAPGWGLVDVFSMKPIDPAALVTDDRIEMTDWEVHDFAVQVVAGTLEGQGVSVTQVQGSPQVDPSIWFEGADGMEWVVVRAVRFPQRDAPRPANIADIAMHCGKQGRRGHFASVGVACAVEPFDGSPHTLWRGAPMHAAYDGLEPAS